MFQVGGLCIHVYIMGGSDYKTPSPPPPPKQVRIGINGGPPIEYGKTCLGFGGGIPEEPINPKHYALSPLA